MLHPRLAWPTSGAGFIWSTCRCFPIPFAEWYSCEMADQSFLMSIAIAILGLVVGSFAWPALLRLPSRFARWACQPFESPGAVVKIAALCSAFLFLCVCLCLFFVELCNLVIPSGPKARSLRGTFFLFSWIGVFVLPFMVKLDSWLRRRRGTNSDKE